MDRLLPTKTLLALSLCIFMVYNAHAESLLISNQNRHQLGVVHGGWGSHVGRLLRSEQGIEWYAHDLGNDVNKNAGIAYFKLDGQQWSQVSSQSLPGKVQQNVASIMLGNIIYSYGVDLTVPSQRRLVECAFDTTNHQKSCHFLPFTLPAQANYIGAALTPSGYRMVWWTNAPENRNGTFEYIVNYTKEDSVKITSTIGTPTQQNIEQTLPLQKSPLHIKKSRGLKSYQKGIKQNDKRESPDSSHSEETNSYETENTQSANYQSNWNGIFVTPLPNYRSIGYVRIAFKNDSEFAITGELIRGNAPNFIFFAAVAEGTIGQPLRNWEILSGIEGVDIWINPNDHNIHVLTRTDKATLNYYVKESDGKWYFRVELKEVFGNGRFIDNGTELCMVYGGHRNGTFALYTAQVPINSISNYVNWHTKFTNTPLPYPSGFNSVNSIWPEKQEFQTAPVPGCNFSFVMINDDANLRYYFVPSEFQ